MGQGTVQLCENWCMKAGGAPRNVEDTGQHVIEECYSSHLGMGAGQKITVQVTPKTEGNQGKLHTDANDGTKPRNYCEAKL